MSQHQLIRVVVERKGGCMSGCGTALAVLLLLGLTIHYWYVALPIVAITAVAAISNASTQRRKAAHKPRCAPQLATRRSRPWSRLKSCFQISAGARPAPAGSPAV
jgi:hypothetical protein